ncbi:MULTISPECIES: 1-(5-phosphoribosyl)-5-[(5-phosphoribosylamino)methylideneamino]imidazole-4-carboxamide isomerase [Clostridium]|uniref:1-(5-phosphoribosyl)-5-[(5-phosphoribosylamino)methylideneamino] imidazole-4-carboxamide isomerase n=1 Tax=Clostridium sporogenes TaxID=1509 RepID=A0ABX4K537_CLOSG|nr:MULTISPECIES: 1-(5-phosphoribosyl)-5-[(5-phosphoribosylamino)methylideneamino]imidazole-4-carboxamide isomerase [Clostridium]MBW5456132.1 1-(5-phosphoribosyl)-5-[(5-phosphoribosylamino)methylideneamino]imidazole-4-carboxamide isomerase [Clostridium sporogenes]MDS1009078.1 1-(5-phosphoribosyl)-5-[(5-phosphoribosylamino)methylideneamino]imidazole-4-carboxamide isomerase [Clostridium sporogenes]MDU7252576.1 1-(5-phosphoribosyl)-5-[(5-phosphoribosylamino)methylideneamino]imidazole-4-carboxamide i
MIILPAIDLKEGKCIRLYQGDFKASKVVAEDPIKVAINFKESGAEYIHIVDLDGALTGEIKNLSIISSIIKTINMPVELGGGIRNLDTIDMLIDAGIERVILGTAALNNRELVEKAVKKYDKKIVIGIDAKNEKVAINGWLNVSSTNYIDFAKEMEKIGVTNIIFTDISKDGTLKGPNLNQLKKLNKSVSCNIIASGGIKDIEDLKVIKEMDIYGAIVGKAIYSGNIDLKEAIKIINKESFK